MRYVASNLYWLWCLFFFAENFMNFECYFTGEEE